MKQSPPLAWIVSLVCVAQLAWARPPGISYAGGDGSSMEKAILIKGAHGEMDGVDAESAYVALHHPDYRKGDQALLEDKGRSFDRIEYKMANGKKTTLYFDITAFFGK